MNDFLQFLNTADLDTLTKIYGLSRPIAGNIIAARPFDSAEDCLKVHGVNKKLLAQIQSTFEVGKSMSESRAMIPVEEEAAHVGRQMPKMESAADERPSFWSRFENAFGVFVRALLRLIALLLLLGGLGTAIYFGMPYLNEKLIKPIDRNTSNISELRKQIGKLQTQSNETNTRMDELEKSIEAHNASLTKLDEIQAGLETEIQTKQDETLLDLKHEVMMTRALDILGRARLYLAQSNFGMAREDAQSARDLLAELQTETGDESLKQVIARLDLALGNLLEFPVVASGDLEIAWQLLMTRAPANVATDTSTPGTLATFTPTALLQPTLEATTTP